MKLLTKEIADTIPPLYAQDGAEDPTVYVKFFDPCGSFTWYILEFDGEDTFFAFVTSSLCPEGELGYVSFNELKSVKNRFGLGMERDLYFGQKKLSECRKLL